MDEHKKKRLLYLIFGWAWVLMGIVFIYAKNYDTASWSFLVAIIAATVVKKTDVIIEGTEREHRLYNMIENLIRELAETNVALRFMKDKYREASVTCTK